MITLDFETYYDKDFSLSKVSTENYIRDPKFQVIGYSWKRDDGPVTYVTGTDEEIAQSLRDLDLPNEMVLAHNAVFDIAILTWNYGIKPKFIFDTLSMSRPVTGLTVGGSLRALSQHFNLGEKGTEVYNTLGKRKEDFSEEDMKRFGEYCIQDVALTYALFHKLYPLSTPREMYLIDLTIRMFTEPVIELDQEMIQTHLDEVISKKQALLDRVALDDKGDFLSNDKFAELLRGYGVNPPTKVSEKTGKEAYAFAKTDDGLKALMEHPDENVQALVAARLGLKSTIEETRAQAFLDISKRGPMPIMLNYYGAVNTGRFSGGDKINPQNLPRGGVLRNSMRAPKGYKIVACDSAQIEARVLPWFAGQKDLVQLFEKGSDVYCSFASKVYKRKISKKDPTERHLGKTCILGLGYGTGGVKLSDTLRNGAVSVDLSVDECKDIVKLYRETYDKITGVWRQCNNALSALVDGFPSEVGVGCRLLFRPTDFSVSLPNGMFIRYEDLKRSTNANGFAEYTYQKRRFRNKIYGGAVTENIVQALARIIVSYQMCTIAENLRKISNKLQDGKIRRVVHMVHDEVVCVVPEEEAEAVKSMMEKVMSTTPQWAAGLPVSCEAGIGDTYGEAK